MLDDIVFVHILPKLPVKSLIRFKSVCKSWLSFISSPCLVESHLLNSSSTFPHFLMLTSNSLLCSLAYDAYDLKELVQLKYNNDANVIVYSLAGCANGLVCLVLYERYLSRWCFALWNPATHEHRKITLHNKPCRWVGFSWFGYVPALNDYIIAAVLKPKPWYKFSLKSGEWKEIESQFNFDISRGGVLVDDTLYCYVPSSTNPLIICYDFVREEFKTLTVKDGNRLSEYINVTLDATKGCLLLCCRKFGNRGYDVWIQDQLCVSGSGWKLFSIHSGVEKVLCFSVTGKTLVQVMGQLKLVDLLALGKDEDIAHCQGTELSRTKYVLVVRRYEESLISPFGSPRV